MKKRYFLIALYIFFAQNLFAQFQGNVYAPFQDANVTQYGNVIRSPWCGGINSVQVNHADLNNDGKNDIILYDFNNDFIKTFINTGNAGEIKYTYDPKYEKNFPAISYYMLLKDYNCDNIPDLFEKGLYGVSVHKGYYQNNELKFTFFKDLFFSSQNGPVNVYVQPSDVPAIIDIDNDGDLDILSYDVIGAQLSFYRNRRVEDGLSCDSIRMELADNCWGKFFQNVIRSVVMNIACKGVEVSHKKTRHTGNTILMLDVDGDNDYDLLGGNISYKDIQLLYNNGSNIIYAEDSNYNKNAHVLAMPYWPVPAHIDIDNDGDKDIIITSHSDNLSTANYNSIAYYKNVGTDANPNFSFQHDTLLTPDMIDVGSYSYPTFFDYDKDGKVDLFVGTEGYLNNNTEVLTSKLAYYKNTSTLGNTSFSLVTKDFLNLSTKNYNGIFPTFGDMTGDGIDDLVLGNTKGTIAVYKNFAPNNNVLPNFLFFTDSLSNVSVDKYSAPVVFDFNNDGKSDLLIGNQLGNLVYFQDTSTTPNLKKMSLVSNTLGNFKSGSVNNFYGHCVPFIGRIDNSQKTFLMVGNSDGNIERYDEHFINNMNNFNRMDSNYSFIRTASRAVPAIADLDGDGKYEMVVGNKYGGLHYYKQVLNVAVGIPNYTLNNNSILLYPNPTNDQISILYKQILENQTASFKVIDMTGRLLHSENFEVNVKNTFNLKEFAIGIYQIEIEIAGKKMWQKIIKKG